MRAAGKKADEALAMLGEAADEMGDTIGAINRLGLGNPSAPQLQSLGERAILTALRDHPWSRAFQAVQPNERRTFSSFLNQWARSLEQAVDAKLNQHKGAARKPHKLHAQNTNQPAHQRGLIPDP